MVKRMAQQLSLIALSFLHTTLFSMVVDNRYFTLIPQPYIHRCEAPSHISIQPLYFYADYAYGLLERTGIPELEGKYDSAIIAKALVTAQRVATNPLRADLQGRQTLPWDEQSTISGQGITFSYVQALPRNFSLNLAWIFAHVNHDIELLQGHNNLTAGEKQYMYSFKQESNQLLGLEEPLFHKTLVGDIDLGLRWGNICHYRSKFRRIDAGVTFGGVLPSGTVRPINNPASLCLGGNRHWGVYAAIDADFEVKEDMHVTLFFRTDKRLSKVDYLRLPVSTEPNNYGATSGQVEVNPGWTIMFAPAITVEGVREGLGVGLQYSLAHHFKDTLSDRRTDTNIPVQLSEMDHRSEWATEQLSLRMFYDFAKFQDNRVSLPTLSVIWNIPVHWSVREFSPMTTSVLLSLDVNF